MSIQDLQPKPSPEDLESLEELYIESDLLQEDLERTRHKIKAIEQTIPTKYYQAVQVGGTYVNNRNERVLVKDWFPVTLTVDFHYNGPTEKAWVSKDGVYVYQVDWNDLDTILEITEDEYLTIRGNLIS